MTKILSDIDWRHAGRLIGDRLGPVAELWRKLVGKESQPAVRLSIVGGLCAVSMGLFVWALTSFFGDPSAGVVIDHHFKCEACKYAFTLDDQAVAAAREASPDNPPYHVDCPECDRKAGARQMVECPKCGEHYLPPKREIVFSVDDEDEESGAGVEASAESDADGMEKLVRDICPYCGTNRIQYLHEQRSK